MTKTGFIALSIFSTKLFCISAKLSFLIELEPPLVLAAVFDSSCAELVALAVPLLFDGN